MEFVEYFLNRAKFCLGNIKNGCVSPLAAPPRPPVRAFDPQGAARSRRWRCGKVMSLPDADSPPTQSDAGLAYLLVTPSVLTPAGRHLGGASLPRRVGAPCQHAITSLDRRLRHPVGTGCHLHDGALVRPFNVMRARWCVGVRPHHAIATPHFQTTFQAL